MSNPWTPPFPKTTSHKHVKKEIPIHKIKRLFHINFTKNAKSTLLQTTAKAFISNEHWIKNFSSSNKCILGLGDNLLHHLANTMDGEGTDPKFSKTSPGRDFPLQAQCGGSFAKPSFFHFSCLVSRQLWAHRTIQPICISWCLFTQATNLNTHIL